MSDAAIRFSPRSQMYGMHLASVDGRHVAPPGWLYHEETDDTRYRLPAKFRLLVADDDDVDRERVRRLLSRSRLNCEIMDAGSGKEALELARHQQLDCILLDYHLGDMTGTDVLARLNDEDISTPVIMITGLGDEQLVVQVMRLGIYDYLPKHKLTKKKLADAIEASLQRAALERRLAEMQAKLQRMSLFDELTGLPNRNLFFDRFSQIIANAERDGSRFVLLMMDLNLFKEVNDNLGHEAGDKVLAEIGSRFRSMSRKSDTIARLGGDEFTCILPSVDSLTGAIAYADKLGAAVSEPLAVDGRMVQVGVSIGIAMYPQHGASTHALLSNADHAMYQAKRSLRNYVVFNERSRERSNTAMPVSNYLHQAIEKGELFLVYQPKIDLVTEAVVGIEALVRWRSPELGQVFPTQFIPFAERSTLIEKITFTTIAMALDQQAAWRRQGVVEVPISVNLSARMLDDLELPARIRYELESRGLQPTDLTLEITETALASSNERAKHVLSELAAAGIGISIDDFGTGFTSFKYIRDIDISEIKIDRLFIMNLAQQARDISIVRSIALLSETMDVQVVAEGVESKENWSLLTELGCRYGQGYSISHPMAAEQCREWLETNLP